MTLPAPVIKDLNLLDAVVRDLAAVADWSVFWHPVNSSFLGHDYGERVRAATGWKPVLPDSEMPNGTVVVGFGLPGGGAVDARTTVVRISHPAPLWELSVNYADATADVLQAARTSASQATAEYASRLSEHLGNPTVGPIGVSPDSVPAPLKINNSGMVAGWRRNGGFIQLSGYEHGGRYEDQPVDFDIDLTVRPESSHG
jgi:hypothetical protein